MEFFTTARVCIQKSTDMSLLISNEKGFLFAHGVISCVSIYNQVEKWQFF